MPSTSFDLAEAVVDYAAGSEANWNSFQLPIPSNIAIFTTDTKKFKRGDGVHKFSELPDGPSIAGIAAGEETIVNVLTTLVPADEDSIIIIDNEIYKPSTTKLSDVMARLTAIANKDTIQDSNLAAIGSQFSMVDTGIIAGDAGKLAIIGSHKMKPGVIPETLVSVAESAIIHIRKFGIYSDKACTVVCSTFAHDSIYYAKIDACHDNIDVDSLSFALTETNAYVSSEHLGRGLFKITVGKPPIGGNLVLTATATYNADTVSVNKTVVVDAYSPIIAAVYGGASSDIFYGVTVDSSNNIICAGATLSEGSGGNDGLVIKFASDLSIIARKRYGGAGNDYFHAVAIDSADNIICAGYTSSEGVSDEALVVKFDSNLGLIARKRYGGAGNDYFHAVAIDSADNIICAGDTSSEGLGIEDTLVVKFASDLSIIARKRYGGAGSDVFYGVAVDSSDNIVCAGYTRSEGLGNDDALVVKFASDLSIIARKRYGGASIDQFLNVAIDSSNNIICTGYTYSDGSSIQKALVVKFASDLSIIARKHYSGTAAVETFRAVAVDSSNNIICAGATSSEGLGNADALVVKFAADLSIIARKRYGGIGNEGFIAITVDNSNNIICAGNTTSEGLGNDEALVIKLPSNIPSGTFTGTTLTGLTLADSTLTLADSTLTLADSTLTLADSTLTLADSTLTLADSTLTLEKDTIEV